MANGKSRIPSSLLWGGIGVIILLLGAGSALFYLNRGQEESEQRFGAIKGIMSRFGGEKQEQAMKGGPGEPPPPAMAPAEEQVRTYTIREGENLWAIARRGELIKSPWEWRRIVVQNKDKIDYASISEDTGAWKVIVSTGKELTVTPPLPGPKAEVKKKLALQLLSAPERNLKRTMAIVKMLLADHYYAYLYLIDVRGVNYYRVRVGFFETKEEAEQAGQEILTRYADKKVFTEKPIVFLPSYREMRGERLDFGVQKSSPFVIEFPQRETCAEAMNDLKQVSPQVEFAYVVKKDSTLCRTRIGYYRTAEDAQAVIQTHGQGGTDIWSQARVTSLETFQEAYPGQQVKVGKPSS